MSLGGSHCVVPVISENSVIERELHRLLSLSHGRVIEVDPLGFPVPRNGPILFDILEVDEIVVIVDGSNRVVGEVFVELVVIRLAEDFVLVIVVEELDGVISVLGQRLRGFRS